MTPWLVAFAITLAAVLQTEAGAWSYLGEAKPPFLLAVVLYFALMRGNGPAMAAALLAGLVQDALGHGRLGVSMWCFAAVAAFVGQSRDKLFPRRTSTHMLLGAGAGAFVVALSYAFHLMDGTIWWPMRAMLAKLCGTVLLALAVVPLTFRAIDLLDNWLGFVKVAEE